MSRRETEAGLEGSEEHKDGRTWTTERETGNKVIIWPDDSGRSADSAFAGGMRESFGGTGAASGRGGIFGKRGAYGYVISRGGKGPLRAE